MLSTCNSVIPECSYILYYTLITIHNSVLLQHTIEEIYILVINTKMNSIKKLSALKRFQNISETTCCQSPISFLADVRHNFDFDTSDDDDDDNYLLSIPESRQSQDVCNKRKRTNEDLLLPTTCVDNLRFDNYESPAKMIKLDALSLSEEEDVFVSDADKHDVVEDLNQHNIPTIEGAHSDLKYITPSTLESLLCDESKCHKNIVIIDCRYPYEFDGGHIKGAINLYKREDVKNTFITQTCGFNTDNTILVFHCEFSSERAPKMCRFLREQDRTAHSDCYPQLYYPEMYVLQGGYKSFYQQNSTTELCEPKQYTPMIHPAFNGQLKHYRKETKKWIRSKSWHEASMNQNNDISTMLSFEM